MALEQLWAIMFIDFMLCIRYVYVCGVFHPNLHPITSIRGVVLEWKKHPTSIRNRMYVRISYYVYSCGVFRPNLHPITSIRWVVFRVKKTARE